MQTQGSTGKLTQEKVDAVFQELEKKVARLSSEQWYRMTDAERITIARLFGIELRDDIAPNTIVEQSNLNNNAERVSVEDLRNSFEKIRTEMLTGEEKMRVAIETNQKLSTTTPAPSNAQTVSNSKTDDKDDKRRSDKKVLKLKYYTPLKINFDNYIKFLNEDRKKALRWIATILQKIDSAQA